MPVEFTLAWAKADLMNLKNVLALKILSYPFAD
jgi:hypothetical protein